jgi:hypothetical protein
MNYMEKSREELYGGQVVGHKRVGSKYNSFTLYFKNPMETMPHLIRMKLQVRLDVLNFCPFFFLRESKKTVATH